MSSMIDEDEIECRVCGRVGMLLNGDYDLECPCCGAEYSYIDDEFLEDE